MTSVIFLYIPHWAFFRLNYSVQDCYNIHSKSESSFLNHSPNETRFVHKISLDLHDDFVQLYYFEQAILDQ